MSETVQISRLRRNQYILIAVVALVFSALPRFLVFTLSVVHWDETVYTLVARDLLRGIVPLSGTFEHKPIMLHYVYALPQLLLGESIFATRLLSIFVAALGAFLAGVVVLRSLSSDLWLACSAAIFYSLFSCVSRGLSPQPELIASIFLLSVWILIPAGTVARSLGVLIAVGVLLGAMFQVNYLTGIFLLAFALEYFRTCLGGASTPSERWKTFVFHGTVIFSSFAVTFVILLLPVLLFGDIAEYFSLQMHYIAGYSKNLPIQRFLADIPTVTRPLFILLTLFCVFVFFLVISALKENWRKGFWNSPFALRMCIFFAAALIASTATGRVYAKYYLMVVAPGVLLLICLANSLPQKGQVRGFFLAWMTLFAAFNLEQDRYLFKQGLIGIARTLKGQPADTPAKIAQDIRPLLEAKDTIYVYDYQIILYFLTGVLPPTRFGYSIEQLDESFAATMNFNRAALMEGILDKEPKFIILGTDPLEGKFGEPSKVLANAISENYVHFGSYNDDIFTQTLGRNRPGDLIKVYVRK
jgi:4-amino-4-deoxy-L-arabinose transferase-like glycosyltransferase